MDIGYAEFTKAQFGFETFANQADIPGFPIANFPPDYGIGKKKSIVRLKSVESYDPFSATLYIDFFLSIARSFLYLHPRNVSSNVDGKIIVVNDKSKAVTIVNSRQTFQPRKTSKSIADQKKSVGNLAKYVFSMPSNSRDRMRAGQRRLISSLNSAALASKTTDKESQLLSIWAAFEALLPEPSTDGDGGVRILHFAPMIVQCSAFDYLHSNFAECYRNCSRAFGEGFIDCVKKLGTGDDDVRKFASIFIAGEKERKELCDTVADSPLMLMRFFRLQKLLWSPNEAIKYAEVHARRVSWQVHRIYRERNDIVHKAETSPFLDSLIENAYSYYRSVVLALERVDARFGVSFPDQAFVMIDSMYNDYHSSLIDGARSDKRAIEDIRKDFLEVIFSKRLHT